MERDMPTPYINAGVRLRSGGVAPTVASKNGRRTPGGTADRKDQNRAIRSWATQQGLKLADRGRISEEIVAAFNAAHA